MDDYAMRKAVTITGEELNEARDGPAEPRLTKPPEYRYNPKTGELEEI
jgi:hypothetical protein